MNNPDKQEVVQEPAHRDHAAPLASAQYLGFYIPGQRVVLNRVAATSETPKVVACEVAHLFEQREKEPK